MHVIRTTREHRSSRRFDPLHRLGFEHPWQHHRSLRAIAVPRRNPVCMHRCAFLLLALAALVASCSSGRQVHREASITTSLQLGGPVSFEDWIHSPLRALDHEAIRFELRAHHTEGLVTAELHVYEYELYRDALGLPSQRRRRDGQWGLLTCIALDTCEGYIQADGISELDLQYTHDEGFGPHTRLEYVWRLIDAEGTVSDRLAMCDVGTSPWPEDKVLLYTTSRAPMRQLIDLAFFADDDYGDSLQLYRRDLETMVREGMLAPQSFGNQRAHWAFYTTNRRCAGRAISEDVMNTELFPSFVKDGSIPGIDAFCLLHRENYTDRSLLVENFHALTNNMFSSEAYNLGTAVHECGHAIFGLSDEYEGCACFQSHRSSNVFRERSACAAWNAEHGFPTEDCYELRDVYERTWYSAEEPVIFDELSACQAFNARKGVDEDSCRSFLAQDNVMRYWAFESTCIMHDDGDDLVRPFQRACREVLSQHYKWLVEPEPWAQDLAYEERRNVYGYEPVLNLELRREADAWTVHTGARRLGVPQRQS